MTPLLDHVTVAYPDLDDLILWLQSHTGLTAEFGGTHHGLGTRNATVPLGNDAYLELIGCDPQRGGDTPAAGQFRTLEVPAPFGWCFRIDTSAFRDQARGAGVNISEFPVSRTRPDGAVLEWKIVTVNSDFGIAVPYFIDWAGTPTPAVSKRPAATLLEVTPHHPRPELINALFSSLGISSTCQPGAAGLTISIAGPAGTIEVGK